MSGFTDSRSEPELDTFWQQKLPNGREAVSWEKVLQLLVVNRLVAPSSEFHVHRQWFLPELCTGPPPGGLGCLGSFVAVAWSSPPILG